MFPLVISLTKKALFEAEWLIVIKDEPCMHFLIVSTGRFKKMNRLLCNPAQADFKR